MTCTPCALGRTGLLAICRWPTAVQGETATAALIYKLKKLVGILPHFARICFPANKLLCSIESYRIPIHDISSPAVAEVAFHSRSEMLVGISDAPVMFLLESVDSGAGVRIARIPKAR